MEEPDDTEPVMVWKERPEARSSITVMFRPEAPSGSFEPERHRITLPTPGRSI